MADKTDKWEENASGKFYVDQQCIDCDLCRETAPAFFTRHDEGGYSYVHKQPETEEDVGLCMEALEGSHRRRRQGVSFASSQQFQPDTMWSGFFVPLFRTPLE